jgi:uncharacterized membrane protein YkvA (DUF1232 family)
MWRDLLIALGAGLLAGWLALLIALLLIRPKGPLLAEAVRLLPDLLRLLRRLAADSTLPRGVRARLALLMIYLALPVDLIPDFLPVIGYADDAIIVAFVLRGVVRRAGIEAVRAHWPGTDSGFAALARLTGLHRVPDGPGTAADPRRRTDISSGQTAGSQGNQPAGQDTGQLAARVPTARRHPSKGCTRRVQGCWAGGHGSAPGAHETHEPQPSRCHPRGGNLGVCGR